MPPEVKDGTKIQADATLTPDKTGTPSYTQEQVDKAVRDAKSAALADVGRLQTESAKAMKTAQEAQDRLNQMLKEQEERELEIARDEPEKLATIRERQLRKQKESELARLTQQLNQKDELVKQHEAEKAEAMRERNTQDIAAKTGVDSVRLAKLAKFTDGSAEAIEDLAKELPKLEPKPPLKPDSGGTIGGQLDRATIIANYSKDPYNRANKERYFELRRKEGR